MRAYIGTKAGAAVLEALGHAQRRCVVVSPYITAPFVERLAQLASAGLSTTLVTSDWILARPDLAAIGRALIEQHQTTDETARAKRQCGRRVAGFAMLASALLGLGSLVAAATVTSHVLAALAVFLAAFVAGGVGNVVFAAYSRIRVHSYTYTTHLAGLAMLPQPGPQPPAERDALPPQLHAKVYVCDDTAFVGSLNFTGPGLIYNVETRVRLNDPDDVEHLAEEAAKLASQAPETLSVLAGALVARGVFAEPPN